MRRVAVRKNRQKPVQAKPQCVISSTASARSNTFQRFVDQLMRRRVRVDGYADPRFSGAHCLNVT
jgi:hypothetical protein